MVVVLFYVARQMNTTYNLCKFLLWRFKRKRDNNKNSIKLETLCWVTNYLEATCSKRATLYSVDSSITLLNLNNTSES